MDQRHGGWLRAGDRRRSSRCGLCPKSVGPGPWGWWSAEVIADACDTPHAIAAIRESWPLVYDALAGAGQATRASCAAALGTLAIETASTFRPVEEAYWLALGPRLAYYADTSKHAYYGRYWGRGFIQLSLEGNYRAVGQRIGLDLVADPELALIPDVAARIFADYWRHHGRENLILEACERHDWREVRRLVQGADAGLDRLVTIAEGLLTIS